MELIRTSRATRRGRRRTLAAGTALAVGIGMLAGTTALTAPAAQGAGVGAGLLVTESDVQFILEQIQIAEAHATKGGPGLGQVVAPTAQDDCTVLPCVTDPTLPHGLRMVDGRGNNLFQNAPVRPAMEAAVAEDIGAADRPFPRLEGPNGQIAPDNWRTTDAGTVPIGPYAAGGAPTTYQNRGPGSVQDNQIRMISNLIADQSVDNPAAVAAAGGAGNVDGATTPATLFIPNIPPGGAVPAPGLPLPQPTNGMFTLFGQFFDHGLDLVAKNGSEFVVMPLPLDDPLFDPGVDGIPGTADDGPNFMLLNRTVLDGNLGVNSTTPWVDQNQTYGSHGSKQVFLREYVDEDSNPATPNANGPLDTGRLVDSTDGLGFIANWGEVKQQARNVLGFDLVDSDVFAVPLLLTDEYGNILPGPNGFPQMVTTASADGGATYTVVEGNPAAPVSTAAAVRTGHSFLDDIAHAAVPSPGKTADADNAIGLTGPSATNYDDEMLAEHFVTGDGRGNENLGLTAIHTMFHKEHNRLRDDIDGIIQASPTLQAGFTAAGWTYEQRLFQAARFVTENEYQHAVFEEFARTLSPAIRPFAAYDPLLNGDISAEFAHAVYRFGHSMLREDVARERPDGTDESMSLLNAFLNPPAFRTGFADSGAAAGSVARGMNKQRSSEIDEFVTGALRNSLLGLPLDLPALNLARGRDTGTPSLNQVRAAYGLVPYASWTEFGNGLRYPQSLQNFIAAYAPDALLTGAGAANLNSEADRFAAAGILMTQQAFMGGLASQTGVDDVDLWMGGLAERPRAPAAGGGLLGDTFNLVFQTTLENLQEGDRFYYLDRLAGLNLLQSIEANTLSEMFMRNTDAEALPADLFLVPSLTLDMNVNGPQAGLPAYPSTNGDGTVTEPAIAAPFNRTLTYGGGGLLNVTISGSGQNDQIQSAAGDDTIRGNDGNDRIQGGDGNDVTVGGNGDDILLDTSGADNMIGGPGNDAFSGATTGDVMHGLGGDDFMLAGLDGAVAAGGTGNDRQLGVAGVDSLTGDDDDDWLEGGAGADALTGDTVAPFGVDINAPGEDVLIGGPGTGDVIDMGGRSDVAVGESNVAANGTVIAQLDDYAGGLGFDWVTYEGSRTPDADLANFVAALPPGANVPGAALDSFIDVEALSGGAFDDTLRGDDRTTLAIDGSVAPITDELLASDIPLIENLAGLLPAGATGFDGNILIGGPGSDTLEGRLGDDLIDGDAYLMVALSVPQSGSTDGGPRIEVSGLTANVGGLTVAQHIINGDLNPSDIIPVKRLVLGPAAGTDVALFSGALAGYTVTDNGDGTATVSGPDGNDIVRNVEFLSFGGTQVTVADAIAATTPAGPSAPTAPQNAVAVGGVGTATVTWEAPASDGGSAVTQYVVEVAVNGGAFGNQTTVAAGGALTRQLTGQTAGDQIQFRIAAENSAGVGAFVNSNTVTVQATAPLPPPPPPAGGGGGGTPPPPPPAGGGGGGGTPPPAGGGGGGTPPPADGGSTPPADGGSTPPADGGSTPPSDGGSTPPSDGGSTPPTTEGGSGGGGVVVPTVQLTVPVRSMAMSKGAFHVVEGMTSLPEGVQVALVVNGKAVAKARVAADGSVVFPKVRAKAGVHAIRSGSPGSYTYSNTVRVTVKKYAITKFVNRPGTQKDTFRVATGAWDKGTVIKLLRNGKAVKGAKVVKVGKAMFLKVRALPGTYNVRVVTDLGKVYGSKKVVVRR